MIHRVEIAKGAQRQLRRVPIRIVNVNALEAWIDLVEHEGLNEARRIPGYHDEPLKGSRTGQRSVRLNIAYRAIYQIKAGRDGTELVEFVSVEEVSKHDY